MISNGHESVDRGSTCTCRTYFLFGVSAKHFSDDVSTTVSQKATTGSETLMSASIMHVYNMCTQSTLYYYKKIMRY